MSASSKKKLRREQEAAKMTEKQLSAQKEAIKTKRITVAFVAVMAVILAVALVVGVSQTITNTGIREKSTTALTLGSNELSNAELNYFYMDAVNNFYTSYGSYASMFGLDVTLPLNEQVVDEETGLTWADDFLATAKENAAAMYAMAEAAEAAGYVLPEEEAEAIESQLDSLDLYATMYGYADAGQYLKAVYGNGATLESYREYSLRNALASSYYNYYSESLSYEDTDLRAKEAENFNAYSSFSFNSYYMATSKFLTGGTTDEEGNTTYTAEEEAAAAEAAKEAAETLVSEGAESVEALDAAIAALSINEGTTAASTVYTDTLYANVNDLYADWLTDDARKEGDIASFASTATAEDGTETVNGYYVVRYTSSIDNTFALKNVRHILVSPEHDHAEDETHEGSYSDEELAAAKATAEEILNQWKSGEATEESFAALANEKSADGDGTTGGLYEDVYPGQMVTNFNDWCFDEARKSGDTGIVESTYGYHIMYFVGDSETTYRDYQIENELRSTDLDAWYTENIDAMEMTDGDTKYIKMDLVLSSAG